MDGGGAGAVHGIKHAGTYCFVQSQMNTGIGCGNVLFRGDTSCAGHLLKLSDTRFKFYF